MGLVEVGVGLIPAGGGTKEMLVRARWRSCRRRRAIRCPTCRRRSRRSRSPRCRRAARCRAARLPRRHRRVHDEPRAADGRRQGARRSSACARAITPAPRTAIPVGGESVSAALKLGVHLMWRAGRASDHDKLIGLKLAHIFGGGNAAARDHRERAVPAGSRARGVPEPARRAQDARSASSTRSRPGSR